MERGLLGAWTSPSLGQEVFVVFAIGRRIVTEVDARLLDAITSELLSAAKDPVAGIGYTVRVKTGYGVPLTVVAYD